MVVVKGVEDMSIEIKFRLLIPNVKHFLLKTNSRSRIVLTNSHLLMIFLR